MAAVRVGLLDSGVGPDPTGRVAASRAFVVGPDGAVAARAAGVDRLGHGTELARIILAAAPGARLASAQAFDAAMAAPAAAVAAGLDWLVVQGVHLVNMSFGLRRDREVLRRACESALEAGVVLVAAAPARGGGAVFPAAYAGVIRVCGDARCAVGEISALGTAQADFGAHPRPLPGGSSPGDHVPSGGSSFAAAHLTGFLARHLTAAGPATDRRRRALELLDRSVSHRGPERRTATARPDSVMPPTNDLPP